MLLGLTGQVNLSTLSIKRFQEQLGVQDHTHKVQTRVPSPLGETYHCSFNHLIKPNDLKHDVILPLVGQYQRQQHTTE